VSSRDLTAAERAYGAIVGLIVDEEIGAGDRLAALSLAERLGVSRTPVREALRRLAAEGIALLLPGGGARLRDPSVDEIRGAYEVRTNLELLALRRAVAHPDPVVLAALDQSLCPGDPEGGAPLGPFGTVAGFHLLLARSGGNAVLAETLAPLLARTSVYHLLFPTGEEVERESSVEHGKIVQALRGGDGDGACRLMEEHLRLGLEALERARARRRQDRRG
jgi:DNA-binding GntR family transcriptional regulator